MGKKSYFILGISFLMLVFSNSRVFSADDLKLNFNAYLDAYLATDNSNLTQNNSSLNSSRLFDYTDNYKDEIALNIALLSATITYKDIFRSKVTIQTGTLPNGAGYDISNIGFSLQEAYIGINLIDNLWLDAGYYMTPIGAESYLPKDNWLSSLSMVTYYEPFYHAGVKLSYEIQDFSACLHVCNGNNIFKDNNKNKSLGWYFKYSGGDIFAVSYAGIIGNEEPYFSQPKVHQLHNFVIESHPTKKLGIKAQLDYGQKENSYYDNQGNEHNGSYLGAALQARYQITEKFAPTARIAYIDNTKQVEGSSINDYIKGNDYTLGLEYKPIDKSYVRLEGRYLKFDDQYKVFIDGNNNRKNSRMEVMLNFGLWFE